MKLDKYKIASYLRDFAILYDFATKYPDISFYSIFKYLIDNKYITTKEDEYIEMLQVVGMSIVSAKMTMLNDSIKPKFFIDDNIPDYLFNNIFVNEEDRYKFRKRDIATYIRNAFSHNENNLYYYFIDNDGKVKVHITLKNTKITIGTSKGTTHPFDVILDITTISKLIRIYNESNYFSRGILKIKKLSSITNKKTYIKDLIDNIYYTRDLYNPLSNKQSSYIRKQIDDISNFNDEVVEDKYRKSIKKGLSQPQKNTVYNNTQNFYKILNISPTSIIFNESEKALVFNSKLRRLNVLSYIIARLEEDMSIVCFLVNKYNDLMSNNKQSEVYDRLGMELYDDYFRETTALQFIDFKDQASLIYSLYIKYMLESVITDEILIIGNKEYDKSKIRNSFVHGKWYLNHKEEFELFDSNTKKEEELFKYNFHKTISIKDINTCMDYYYEKLKEESENKKVKTKYMI